MVILKELLDVERGRLEEALRIERERKIVFPETTVIIKDIERLMLEIERRESAGVDGKKDHASDDDGAVDLSFLDD